MWVFVFTFIAITARISQGKHAVCLVRPNPAGTSQPVSGVITLCQESEKDHVNITINISGFHHIPESENETAFLHGFHVHETGNISGGCENSGGHYNPDGVNHGGRHDAVRHAGDFGNIRQSPIGQVKTSFIDTVATLFGDKSIIGRALVVHADVDDLGKGGNPSSLLNGNAGARLACCVIKELPEHE